MEENFRRDILARMQRVHLPVDYRKLSTTPEGKIAVFTGSYQGKADRLHKKAYNPPKFDIPYDSPDINFLQKEAYRKAYLGEKD